MYKKNRSLLWSTVAILVLVLFVFNAASLAQEKKEEAPEKKYAPVTGDYEFDLTDMGIGIMTVNFYIENGSLWAMSETSSEPAELEEVEDEDEEFKFQIDDPNEGLWEISFIKDENGKYTKCRLVNGTMMLDVTGIKKEGNNN